MFQWLKKLTDKIMPLEPLPEEVEAKKTTKPQFAYFQDEPPGIQQSDLPFQVKEKKEAEEKIFNSNDRVINLKRDPIKTTASGNNKSTANNTRYDMYPTNFSTIPTFSTNKSSTVIVKIHMPTKYDERVKRIAEDLIKEGVVILNYEAIDDIQRQRISDFILGVIYAINGKFEVISDRIILYVPKKYEINNQATSA